ncbi:MAG: PEP-CTERM sorting domain-containing protein [Sedimenticola sp.]
MKKVFSAIIASITLLGTTANAGVIGSFDSTRAYSSYYLEGSNYDDIRNAILADGHSVASSTSTVTTSYLGSLDVFYTGMLDTAATASEITALQSFVTGGGTLVIGADNTAVNSLANYNSWFNPFGLSVTGGSASGGTWSTSTDDLLANGVAGTALGFLAGTDFAAGSYTTLATDSSGDAAVVSLAYGSGLVIGLGDGNFNDDPASIQSQQFFQNIMSADSNQVPVPAPLALIGIGLAAIGFTTKKRKS